MSSAPGWHTRIEDLRPLWPLALVIMALLAIRPEVRSATAAGIVDGHKGPGAEPFDDGRARALGDPDVVIIGNSMAYSRIDPQLLGDVAGRQVGLVGMSNSHAVHWYLALKNVVAPLRPRTVFVFFQNTQLLEVPSHDRTLQERLSHDEEPALAALAARDCTTLRARLEEPAHAALVRMVPLLGVERSSAVSDVVDWLLPSSVWRGREPFAAHLEWNTIFELGQLRVGADVREATGAGLDGDEIEARWSCSLVPDMLAVARDAGIRLVFIRVQDRPRPGQGPAQSAALVAAVAAIKDRLEAAGAGFHDFTGDPAITLDMYSYGSHISDAARPQFTRHFFSVTRRFWDP